MASTFYALGLHMHQPPENMRALIESNEWEAQQIMNCYARAAQRVYSQARPDSLPSRWPAI